MTPGQTIINLMVEALQNRLGEYLDKVPAHTASPHIDIIKYSTVLTNYILGSDLPAKVNEEILRAIKASKAKAPKANAVVKAKAPKKTIKKKAAKLKKVSSSEVEQLEIPGFSEE